MTETLQEETREAPEMPLHMRREGFDPVREMAALRDDEGVRQVETAFGMPAFLVARHADVKAVLAEHPAFPASLRELASWGVHVLEQAPQPRGVRMAPWEAILEAVERHVR